jgi:hypothetical protein
MTTDHSLDERIRSCVLEIVDSAAPAPVLQLDQLGPTVDPWWTPRRTAVVIGGMVIAISVIVVAWLLVARGSSQEVSEVQLGLQLTSRVTTTQPVQAGQDPVATGTFFGHPWLVSGINTWNTPGGELCVGFSYRRAVLSWTCETNQPPIPTPPPWWERSVWVSLLQTASDGQRFLVAMTNSTVTKLTVRAPGGTFVSAAPLAEHLGNTSFFVLSLGRERGPCYGLCLGSVTYSLATPSGPTLIDTRSSMTIQDKGGEVMPLSAPVRGEH